MRLRPLATLPLRVSLKVRLQRARRERRDQARNLQRAKNQIARTNTRGGHTQQDRLHVDIHPYALVGHQISAWLSGYLWAQDLGLVLEASPLSRDPERNYALPTPPRSTRKLRRVRLKSVSDERDPESLELLRLQVELARRRWPKDSFRFILPLDQPRWDLTPAAAALREAVVRGPLGAGLRARESENHYVAIHIRRPASTGEISRTAHPDRWIEVDWYVNLISQLRSVEALRELPIRVIALGDADEFETLSQMDNVELSLNGDREDDFVTLAGARLLVIAPSSFSFNAALVSRGVVVGRTPWWHNIPNSGRWVSLPVDRGLQVVDLERALTQSDGRHSS